MSAPPVADVDLSKTHNVLKDLKGIARYGEPGRISPLIKFSRYAALFLGIAYGSFRSGYIQRRADRLKELRDKRKAERLAREAIEKKHTYINEMKYLSEVTGADFTSGIKKD